LGVRDAPDIIRSSMAQPIGPDIYTVARLNREVRALLQTGLPSLWVEGEVSRVARPASGHLYFELKDPAARVRCVLWRARAALYARDLSEGAQVLVRARATLYEDRGEYQLDVEHLEAAGEGRLRRAFEDLKRRLAAEGLFDAATRRSVPPRPRRIGVITSASGAALHDVLTTLRRRAPWVSIIVYPSSVQGAAATAELCAALATADARAEVDVLLLVRGGGSLEDLWCFNEEALARAIRASRLPVVSGVGHEVDVTIADLAADLRAPTPTAAAELVTADAATLSERAGALGLRLGRAALRSLATRTTRLDHVAHRLTLADPRTRLGQRAQRLDDLEARLQRGMAQRLVSAQQARSLLSQRLLQHSPATRLTAARARLTLAGVRVRAALDRAIAGGRARTTLAARTLHAVSPLATLARGYAIVTDEQDRLIADAAEVAVGDTVRTRLARGRLRLTVTGKEEG
jgi:exodeoxyribonuclease VII large subunit